MKFFPDMQTVFEIGFVSIKWYAVLILTGAFLAYYLSLRNLKKMGYSSSKMDDLFFGALLSGVVGARLWFVLLYDVQYYLSNPLEILQMWEGGLAIQGGLVGGVIFAYFFTKKNKMNFIRLADAVFPNILVAQAIGRWGNFANQEAFGRAVDASYFEGWPTFIANHMFIQGAYREPTFLYESVLNIVGFLLIVLVYKRFSKVRRGDMVYAYLMWYGVIRFFIEGLRSDSLMFFGLRSAQIVSIIFIILGVLGSLGVFRKFYKQQKPVILFDFDGTLMDTEPAILETYRQIFEKYQPETVLTKEMELSFLGPTLWQTFERYFPGHDADALVKEYREINFELHKTLVQPMNKAKEVIKQLKAEGYPVGIVSSKLQDAVKLASDMFEMTEDFDVILGLDDVKTPKPNPEGLFKACKQLNRGHDALIYVGDTVTDVQTAKNAGAYSVAIVSNEHRRQDLIDSKPNKVIDHLEEILEIVKEDVEWTYNMM